MHKKLFLVGLLAVFFFTLHACSNPGRQRMEDETNTLYVGYQADSFPTSFMPWLSREGIAPTVASMMYNTLFAFDLDTGNFDPLIGKTWYYVDEAGEPLLTDDGEIDYERLDEIYSCPSYDYLPVKVILHDDVTWSDGTPLTVEDVYFSYDTGANNAISNHAGALAWTADLQHSYRDGVLRRQGIFTYDHGAAEQGYVIDEVDRDTVMYLHVDKILGAVSSLFTSMLILPSHIWEPIISEDNPLNSASPQGELLFHYRNPVGSGPWTLDLDASSGQQIVMHRREDFHLKDDDEGPLYKVDTIRFLLFQEINVAIYALLKGHIDVLNSTVSANYSRLFDTHDNIFVSEAPGTFAQTLVFNVNPVESERNPMRDLLSNETVRRAMALAVDQQFLIDMVLNGAGEEMSPGLMPSHMEDFYNPDAWGVIEGDYEARLLEANALLDTVIPDRDTSGYRLLEGDRVGFDILGHPGEQDLISYLEVLFERIGIEIDYAPKGSQPERTYLYRSRFDMTLQTTIFSLQNIDIMYRAHFVTIGETSNYGRLIDADMNAQIARMRSTLDLDEKYELIKSIQPMIAENYYKVPLYSANVLSVARTDRFDNWQVVPGATVFNGESLQNLRRVHEGE